MSYDHWHKILVVFAHPDDAEIHCGGTLAKLKAQLNSKITYVVATNGDKGTKSGDLSPFALAENRENEQLAAAAKIGVERVVFLRHPDGDLSNTIALRNDLALLIRHFTPDVIFVHDPWQDYQLHPDHRNLGTALTDAIIVAREIHALAAQTAIGLGSHSPTDIMYFRTNQPNYSEDITDYIDNKLEAVKLHKSQMEDWDEWKNRILNRAIEAGKQINVQYAEEFHRFVLSQPK